MRGVRRVGGQRGEATLYRCGSIKVTNTHLNYCARVLVRRKVLSGMKLHADDDKKDEEEGDSDEDVGDEDAQCW